MWTQENRHRYDRGKLCYPSDLTDEEWSQVAPLIPPAKRGGKSWPSPAAQVWRDSAASMRRLMFCSFPAMNTARRWC